MRGIKEYIESVNKEFIEVIGGSFVRVDTGEIFNLVEVQKYVQKKMEKYTKRNLDEIKHHTFESMGVEPDQLLVKRKEKKHKNNKSRFEGGEFNIVYREKIEGVISLKLEVNEKLVYYVLRDFIAYPSNCVMINEEIPTFEQLEPIIGLKERTIRKALKSLEVKGLIKLRQSGHRKAIYVNPSYYASGKDLNIDVLEMFDLVQCDNGKVDSYL